MIHKYSPLPCKTEQGREEGGGEELEDNKRVWKGKTKKKVVILVVGGGKLVEQGGTNRRRNRNFDKIASMIRLRDLTLDSQKSFPAPTILKLNTLVLSPFLPVSSRVEHLKSVILWFWLLLTWVKPQKLCDLCSPRGPATP
ncbi:hypothetical protein RRG08_049472 [Elysia crispata]|uniref:Uncharacterized protein n=1 Tax=Elysia crispata TaxID=231223 RepID=A0AAE0ZTB3_9GAST|nr:hypothetical protein RRG08_049472 [Elysia crispata]